MEEQYSELLKSGYEPNSCHIDSKGVSLLPSLKHLNNQHSFCANFPLPFPSKEHPGQLEGQILFRDEKPAYALFSIMLNDKLELGTLGKTYLDDIKLYLMTPLDLGDVFRHSFLRYECCFNLPSKNPEKPLELYLTAESTFESEDELRFKGVFDNEPLRIEHLLHWIGLEESSVTQFMPAKLKNLISNVGLVELEFHSSTNTPPFRQVTRVISRVCF